MLGRSLLDVGPISLTEDGLDADQAEHRYAAWVAPYHLPEEGGAEPGLSKATPPRHRCAPGNVVPQSQLAREAMPPTEPTRRVKLRDGKRVQYCVCII